MRRFISVAIKQKTGKGSLSVSPKAEMRRYFELITIWRRCSIVTILCGINSQSPLSGCCFYISFMVETNTYVTLWFPDRYWLLIIIKYDQNSRNASLIIFKLLLKLKFLKCNSYFNLKYGLCVYILNTQIQTILTLV